MAISDEEKVSEDVTTVLAMKDRWFFAFGKWKYPGTDFHKVIITDKYGTVEGEGKGIFIM